MQMPDYQDEMEVAEDSLYFNFFRYMYHPCLSYLYPRGIHMVRKGYLFAAILLTLFLCFMALNTGF